MHDDTAEKCISYSAASGLMLYRSYQVSKRRMKEAPEAHIVEERLVAPWEWLGVSVFARLRDGWRTLVRMFMYE